MAVMVLSNFGPMLYSVHTFSFWGRGQAKLPAFTRHIKNLQWLYSHPIFQVFRQLLAALRKAFLSNAQLTRSVLQFFLLISSEGHGRLGTGHQTSILMWYIKLFLNAWLLSFTHKSTDNKIWDQEEVVSQIRLADTSGFFFYFFLPHPTVWGINRLLGSFGPISSNSSPAIAES